MTKKKPGKTSPTRKPARKSPAKTKVSAGAKRAPTRAKPAASPSVKSAVKPAGKPAAVEPLAAGALDDFIAAAALVLALPIEPAWLPAIKVNLDVTLRLGAQVAAFELADEAEPAPVFGA
jgi:hypothetical protein